MEKKRIWWDGFYLRVEGWDLEELPHAMVAVLGTVRSRRF